MFDTPNDILLCYLHPLQPFSKEAEREAEAVAEALKKIDLEVEADLEANFTPSTSLGAQNLPNLILLARRLINTHWLRMYIFSFIGRSSSLIIKSTSKI